MKVGPFDGAAVRLVGWAKRSVPTLLMRSGPRGHGAKMRLCPPYKSLALGPRYFSNIGSIGTR
jgi:hypothetical protein